MELVPSAFLLKEGMMDCLFPYPLSWRACQGAEMSLRTQGAGLGLGVLVCYLPSGGFFQVSGSETLWVKASMEPQLLLVWRVHGSELYCRAHRPEPWLWLHVQLL